MTGPSFSPDGKLVSVGESFRHIAFIMDGNGRWAKKRGKPRTFGHTEGAKAFERVLDYCGKVGIKYVTVYAFSTENWSRPKEEVDKIMSLLDRYIETVCKKSAEYDVRVKFIGEKTFLSEKLLEKMKKAEEATKDHERIACIALNYGGRAEIVNAFNRLAEKGVKNITEKDISAELYTSEIPDPDLIVRTSGEMRLSNFLCWQAAYSEFYFTDTLWPDMKDEDVEAALKDYFSRHRRFGNIE